MQQLSLQCPHCGKKLSGPAEKILGRRLHCPGCQGEFTVPGAAPTPPTRPAPKEARRDRGPIPGRHPTAEEDHSPDHLFACDRFRLRQKLLQFTVHKQVFDADGQELFHVEEPRPWMRQFLARLAIAGALLPLLLITYYVVKSIPKPSEVSSPAVNWLNLFLMLALISACVVGPALAFHLASPRFNIRVYRSRDGQRGRLVLTIRTEHPARGLRESVLVEDGEGRVLGRFTRNWLRGRLSRGHWQCSDEKGRRLFAARQGPTKRLWAATAARIYCQIPVVRGMLLAWLEPEWEIRKKGGQKDLASFRPAAEIDWKGDPARTVDRRLGLSFGLLLDSGRWRLLDLVTSWKEKIENVEEIKGVLGGSKEKS